MRIEFSTINEFRDRDVPDQEVTVFVDGCYAGELHREDRKQKWHMSEQLARRCGHGGGGGYPRLTEVKRLVRFWIRNQNRWK